MERRRYMKGEREGGRDSLFKYCNSQGWAQNSTWESHMGARDPAILAIHSTIIITKSFQGWTNISREQERWTDTSRMLESGIDLVLKLRHFNAAFEQLKQHLHGYARCPQKGTSELSTNTFGLRAWLSLYSNRMDWFGLLCESLFWKLIFKRPCK